MSALLLMFDDGPPFPRSLFSSGEQGIWLDPSDFSTLFQDSAGTTPVTAVGQPVGKILDKSGRGNHATQTTAARRPTVEQDSNGLYYLSFDGTDDRMLTPSIDFSLATDIEVFLGLVNNVTTHQKLVMLGTYSTQTGSFELSVGEVVSGALVIAKGNTASNFLTETGAKAAPRKSVVYSKVNKVVTSPGAGGVIRVNSMASASSPGGSGGGYSFANAAFYIGSASTGSLVLNGRIYQLIVRGAASNAGQIAATEAWCNAKTRAY